MLLRHESILFVSMKKKYVLIIIYIFCSNSFGYSATKKDSLLTELGNARGKEKLIILTELIYAFKNDSTKAIKYYNQAKQLANQENNFAQLSEIYINKSWIYKVNYQYKPFLGSRRQAVKYAELSENMFQIADAYSALRGAYSKNGKIDSALICSRKALNTYMKLNDSLNIGTSYDGLALVLYERCRYDSALIYSKKSEDLVRKYGSTEDLAVVLYHKGLILQAKGRFFEAVNLYFNLIEKFKQLKQTSNVWNTYDMLGNIFYRLKEYDRSLELYTQAYEIKLVRDHKLAIAYSLNNFARVYNELGLLDTALFLSRKSLKIKLKYGNQNDIANSEEYMARIFNNLARVDSALIYANKAFDKYTKVDNLNGSALAALNVAQARKIQNNKASLKWIDSALIKLKPEKDIFIAAKVYKEAYDIYKSFGNNNKALKYLELYNHIMDTLQAGKKSYQIQFLENRSELQDKIIDETLLKTKLQRHKAIQIVGLSISFLLLIILILLIRLHRQKKLRQQAQIEHNKEMYAEQLQKEKLIHETDIKHLEELHEERKRKLVTSGAHLEKKNVALKKILEEVIKMSNGDRHKCNPEKLVREIKNEIDDQKDWTEFEMSFNEINPGKLSYLKFKHPNLSDSDLRFCAYILINSDNSTLANVLSISIDSVRKKKTRLKKRLRLNKNESMIDYLKNLSSFSD